MAGEKTTYSEEEIQEYSFALKERINELMADQAFVEKLVSTEEPEDVQKLFEERGVSMTLEYVHFLGKVVERCIENDGELSEEDLEEVAGGWLIVPPALVGAAAAVAPAAAPLVFNPVGVAIAGVVGVALAAVTLGVIFKDKVKNFFRRW